MSFDLNQLTSLPKKPGVYLMKNSKKEVLYVGKAKILRDRVKQYFKNSSDTRAMIPILIEQIDSIESIVTFTEKEALILENTLIKKYKPKYNILLKDDKSFISLMINHKHKWPMLKLVRHKNALKKDVLYFGPYTSALAARQTYDIITKIFPLRQCSDRELTSRSRPCLLYSIKRCIAPCVNKCTKSQYDQTVKNAIDFLKGKNKSVIANLKTQMEKASDLLEFEKAGAILKTISQIKEITAKPKKSVQVKIKECDAYHFYKKDHFTVLGKLMFRNTKLIAFEHFEFSLTAQTDSEMLTSFLLQHYQEQTSPKEILLPIHLIDQSLVEEILKAKLFIPQKGEKKNLIDLAYENAKTIFEQEQNKLSSDEDLLMELEEVCKLNHLPSRIECFDTSNLTGGDNVASMVTFTDGLKDTKRYRLYKIKDETHKDDYSALEEILTRRLERAKKEDDLPNLIIVDGGKGQLSIAIKILYRLDIASIDVIAITKEDALHTKGLTKERIFIPGRTKPIELDSHSPLLFFLQTIRDEAHRKAITFHRKSRSARTIKSALDDIPGIGPIKKQALLKTFGSIKRIKEASKDEILSVNGISKKDYNQLQIFL